MEVDFAGEDAGNRTRNAGGPMSRYILTDRLPRG